MRMRISGRRVLGLIALVALVASVSGCFSKKPPVRLYPAYDGGIPVELDGAFGRLSDGDKVIVVLSDGCRFEAKFRGLADGFPSFEELRWLEPMYDRCSAGVAGHSSWTGEEIAQLLKHESNRADNIVAAVSVAAGACMLYVYSSGQGGDPEE